MTEFELEWLLSGVQPFFDDPISFERGKKLWQANQKRIMESWLRTAPGSRPAGWWLFEAVEPRQLRPGVPPEHDDEHRKNWRTRRETFRYGIELPHFDNERYESEAEYLRRLGLLTLAEHCVNGNAGSLSANLPGGG